MNKANETDNLEYALQVLINKAEDKEGNKLFSEAEMPTLKTRNTFNSFDRYYVQNSRYCGGGPTVNSKAHLSEDNYLYLQFFLCEKLGYTIQEFREKVTHEELIYWSSYLENKK